MRICTCALSYVNCIEDVFHTHTHCSGHVMSCHAMSCHVMSCDSCLVSPISQPHLCGLHPQKVAKHYTANLCNSYLPTVASQPGSRIISANWYTQAPLNHWRGEEEEAVLKLLYAPLNRYHLIKKRLLRWHVAPIPSTDCLAGVGAHRYGVRLWVTCGQW